MSFRVQPFLGRLKASAFIRNFLIVFAGTAVAQVLGFALSPVISRLFSPSDFGVFGSFSSIANIIGAAATLEYAQAIMLPREKDDALHLFLVSCLCTFATGSLCLLACLLAPGTMNGLLKTSGAWALALLVVGISMSGLNASCQAWCVRVKAFKHTSASQVVRSLSSNGSQVGFGLLSAGAPGLIVASVLADAVATVNLIRVLLPDLKARRSSIRWERIKQLAHDYRDFPKYAASENVISALSNGIPVLLLTYFYGIAVAGAYAFGVRLLSAPMALVLRALRQVLFQKAGETQHQGGSLVPLFLKTTTGLFGIALIPSLLLIVWAPQLFTCLFGAQWHTAGEFARSLVLWMLFAFCVLPASLFAQLIRIQRTILLYNLVLLAARTLALVLGGRYLSASQTILIFSLVGAVMNAVLILLVGRAVGKKECHSTLERIGDCPANA